MEIRYSNPDPSRFSQSKGLRVVHSKFGYSPIFGQVPRSNKKDPCIFTRTLKQKIAIDKHKGF
jgi:hypothetical protein